MAKALGKKPAEAGWVEFGVLALPSRKTAGLITLRASSVNAATESILPGVTQP